MTRACALLGLALLFAPACADEVIGFIEPASTSVDGSTTEADQDTGLDDTSSGTATPPAGMPDAVVGGLELRRMASFDQGATWQYEQVDTEAGDSFVEGIARGPDRIVMVGGPHTLITENGSEWESFTDSQGYQRAVVYGADRFVSVGLDGRRSWSTDGWGWVNEPDDDPATDYFAIAYGGGRFLAAAADHLAVSTDGQVWLRKPITGALLFAAAWGNDRFVLVGDEGRVFVTTNGETILHDETSGFGYISNCFYDGEFYALGYGGLRVSSDGIDWVEFGTTPDLDALGCSPTSLLGVDEQSIYRSTDGVRWTPSAMAAGQLTRIGGAQ